MLRKSWILMLLFGLSFGLGCQNDKGPPPAAKDATTDKPEAQLGENQVDPSQIDFRPPDGKQSPEDKKIPDGPPTEPVEVKIEGLD